MRINIQVASWIHAGRTPVARESCWYSERKRIGWEGEERGQKEEEKKNKKYRNEAPYLFHANSFHYTRTDWSIGVEWKDKQKKKENNAGRSRNKRDVVSKGRFLVQGNRGSEQGSVKTIREKNNTFVVAGLLTRCISLLFTRETCEI